jgi:DNA-binding NtrC family response regulator
MRHGATDFLQKPWNNERLISILRTQIQLKEILRDKLRLQAENDALRSDQQGPEFVCSSPAMQKIERLVRRIAPSDANVLITGESGTGKSVIAQRLHQLSARANRSFISLNMGAIPDGLFESEMFGHVKGAFTDARTDRVGRFELAHEGTLFLDEIANLNSAQQAKILRVLETGEFERVGASKTLAVDVRLLSATNADLAKEIQSGKFREDLFFRLNTIQIHLPALRERLEDLPALVRATVRKLGPKYRKPDIRLSTQAMNTLMAYSWPGNIRELRHVLERSILLANSNEIDASGLWLQAVTAKPVLTEEMDLEKMEAHLIRRALARHSGNANLASKSLGLSRSALYRRLQKYHLTGEISEFT